MELEGLENALSVEQARALPLSQVIDVNSFTQEEKLEILAGASLTESEYNDLLELAQPHFENTGRETPFFTKPELDVLGTMLSEHTSYKSSKNVLKILPIDAANVVVPVGEDAGAVYIGKNLEGKGMLYWGKSESHNHPSMEKLGLFGDGFQGATTGIGGILRDLMCMNASPIGVLDGQRYGDIRDSEEGKFIRTNVQTCTSGIAGYGNPFGVPHLHGSIQFSPDMDGNTLQQVGCVGISALDEIIFSSLPDDVKYAIGTVFGKETDTTGMGGANFASKVLKASEDNLASVQDGNPFMEKIEDSLYRDIANYLLENGKIGKVAIQDMGAAGILCSTIEPGSKSSAQYNITVNGDTLPNSFPAEASPEELTELLMKSETQERHFAYTDEETAEVMLDLANNKHEFGNLSIGAGAFVTGRADRTEEKGSYIFTIKGTRTVDLPVDLITKGITYDRESSPKDKSHLKDPNTSNINLEEAIQAIISDPNVASDRVIHVNYDKQIGRNRGHPVLTRGIAPAATIKVEGMEKSGVAACMTGQTLVGIVDPKYQAENAVLDAAWRLAAVGASMIAVSNNANYGNPEIPEHFWEFEQGQKGVKNALENLHFAPDYKAMLEADGYEGKDTIPVIGGNVSLYNVQPNGDSINPSTVIMGMGWTRDVNVAVTNDLKKDGGDIYLIGKRNNHIAGSLALNALNMDTGRTIDNTNYLQEEKNMYALIDAVHSGAVSSSDVVAGAGLGATLARMSSNGDIGVEVDIEGISDNLDDFKSLFSESRGAVVQVNDEAKFRQIMERHGAEFYNIGKVTESGYKIRRGNDVLADTDILESYRTGLENRVIPK